MSDALTLPANPRCPAAVPIRGASPAMQGVICRVMQDDQADDPGVGMSAGRLRSVREGVGGVYLNLKSDPSTVQNFCHGPGLPSIDPEKPTSCYTYCPVWQARLEADWQGRDALYEQPVPEPVSMGVEPLEAATHSLEAPDPWSQARRDLDLLAPEKAA